MIGALEVSLAVRFSLLILPMVQHGAAFRNEDSMQVSAAVRYARRRERVVHMAVSGFLPPSLSVICLCEETCGRRAHVSRASPFLGVWL